MCVKKTLVGLLAYITHNLSFGCLFKYNHYVLQDRLQYVLSIGVIPKFVSLLYVIDIQATVSTVCQTATLSC